MLSFLENLAAMPENSLMPDWLGGALSIGSNQPVSVVAWRIGVALILGLGVSWLHRWARRGEMVQASFSTTLILLATVIAMATQVIGDNVARAFSLVGALSVVRFRTVVKDTQDTAFVIFAVVVGMASGANNLLVGLVGMAIVGIAAFVLWPPRRSGDWVPTIGTLTIRVGLAEDVRTTAENLIRANTTGLELVSAATAKQGTAMELTYRVRLRPTSSPTQLVTELNLVAGVDSVDLRRAD